MATLAPHYDPGLDPDEDEQERLLSALHGEASDDDVGPKRKRPPSKETALTEEDAAAAAAFEEKVRRKKPRPTLTPLQLKSDKGLVYVRRSFPTSVKKFREVPHLNKARGAGTKSTELARKINAQSQIKAAASYSRSLLDAYHGFAHQLFPSLAAEDVFLKVEDLGSKKEVKDYLQVMRDEVRREYMEGIYGKERAGRILHEVEHGLRVHPAMDRYGAGEEGTAGGVVPRMGYAANDDEEVADGAETPPASPPAVVANPYAKKAAEVAAAEEGGEKNATETDGGAMVDVAAKENEVEAGKDSDEEEEATFSVDGDDTGMEGAKERAGDDVKATDAAVEEKAPEKGADGLVDSDDDEEMEATFDDDATKVHDDEPAEDDASPAPAVAEEQGVIQETAEATSEEVAGDDEPNKDESAEPKEEESAEANAEPCVVEDAVEPTAADDTVAEEFAPEEKGHGIDTTAVENETPTQVFDEAPTQESLTLVASQCDDVDMGAAPPATDEAPTQGIVETPTQLGGDDDGFTPDDGGRFSQTQDERFSQAGGEDAGKEVPTQDDRFSQFTQSQFTQGAEGPIFEADEDGDNHDDGENAEGNDRLGQTMNTQLSMEY